MIDERVKSAVLSIMAREKNRDSANWAAIEAEASETIAYVNENGIEVNNLVYHFLEDADARKKSEVFAARQTADVLKCLGNGDGA